MLIGKVSAKHFQSFEELVFDYSGLGLTLISGQTKAGKSTLMDVVPWVLYGVTSKESLSDDVKSWFATGQTEGSVTVHTPAGVVTVTRIRGSAKQNDLYYTKDGQGPLRGTNAAETQKHIDDLLGVSADLFLDGSYLHQFSKADQFFVAKATARRETLERVADLSLPVKLADRASAVKSEVKKALAGVSTSLSKLQGEHVATERALQKNIEAREGWETKHAILLSDITIKAEDFEKHKSKQILDLASQIEQLAKQIKSEEEYDARTFQLKNQIKQLEAQEQTLKDLFKQRVEIRTELSAIAKQQHQLCELSGVCPTCLGEVSEEIRAHHLSEAESQTAKLQAADQVHEAQQRLIDAALSGKPKLMAAYTTTLQDRANNGRLIDRAQAMRREMEAIKESKNTCAEQLESLQAEVNPYSTEAEEQRLAELVVETSALTDEQRELERLQGNLDWLYDASMELRGQLLIQAVQNLETRTNEILEKFFDAELRVKFTLPDADKLVVTIHNEGYECPYKQLSGGERCLLKLAFMLAYMKAAENRAGVKFENLMLDEALNGLDASLKVKAFTMLQSLEDEYSSILVIDHAEEFKQMFETQYLVEKRGAYSYVTGAEQ